MQQQVVTLYRPAFRDNGLVSYLNLLQILLETSPGIFRYFHFGFSVTNLAKSFKSTHPSMQLLTTFPECYSQAAYTPLVRAFYNSCPLSMLFDKSLINRAICAPSITSWSINTVRFSMSLITMCSSCTTGFLVIFPIPKQTG